ncbi:MAG: 3-mercaptopyruvate sulfurtransferase [Xanthobacteraceae bacterium]|nr:3-mercaptopyruvate sulfurtransferase [Xanthobacteraceae bacterium]
MPASNTFVTPEWLAAEYKKPDLVVVDGSWYLPAVKRNGRAEYQAAHIPGAVYFDIDEVKDINSTLPHMLPPPEVFALHMARLGISDGQRIVVYDGAGLFSAPRVWFTFKLFGAKEVYILEGGFAAWKAGSLPVESGSVARTPGRFTPKFSRELVANMERVDQSLKNGTAQVVDARPAGRFRGDDPEPRAGVASGHIPGSINVPSSAVVVDGKLAPPEQIRKIFDEAGLDPDKPIIASCGSGVSAVTLWVALEAIGIKPAALYDGSWSEWGTNPSMPKATGPAKKR